MAGSYIANVTIIMHAFSVNVLSVWLHQCTWDNCVTDEVSG